MRAILVSVSLTLVCAACNTTPPPVVDPCDNDILDVGEGDVDCGESCGTCDVNRACRNSADCGDGVCVEVIDPVRAERPGVCWVPKGFSGCARVPNGPQPCATGFIHALCQWGYNSEMLKHCDPPSQDKSVPNIVCCDASMWTP